VSSVLTAVEAIQRASLRDALRDVAEALPLVVSAESATIRVSDTSQKLHLLAAAGSAPTDALLRAVKPLDLAVVRALTASELFGRQASAHGFRWIEARWLGGPNEPVGLILVGARTERRPLQRHLDLLDDIAERLGSRLSSIERSPTVLRSAALRFARSIDIQIAEGMNSPEVAELRPRERAILELYAEGLATDEIAEALVISRHTVRTHVKSALRTLGVHTRAEAAALVRSSHLAQLF